MKCYVKLVLVLALLYISSFFAGVAEAVDVSQCKDALVVDRVAAGNANSTNFQIASSVTQSEFDKATLNAGANGDYYGVFAASGQFAQYHENAKFAAESLHLSQSEESSAWATMESLGNGLTAYIACINGVTKARGLNLYAKFVTPTVVSAVLEWVSQKGLPDHLHYAIRLGADGTPFKTGEVQNSVNINVPRSNDWLIVSVDTTEGESDSIQIPPNSPPPSPTIPACGGNNAYTCPPTGSYYIRQSNSVRFVLGETDASFVVTNLIGRTGVGCRFKFTGGVRINDISNVRGSEVWLNNGEVVGIDVRSISGAWVSGYVGTRGASNGQCFVYTSENFRLMYTP